MLKSFFLSKEYGAYAWLMLAWLLSMIWYNVEILVFYNFWNKEIYDVIPITTRRKILGTISGMGRW